MKKHLILFLIVLVTWPVFGQTNKVRHNTDKSKQGRGHYNELSLLDPTPEVGEENSDKQRFPFDVSQAERRLSLKPVYLDHLTVDDFKIPDPPANSSRQTRAELNYLLRLQQKRTDNDVQMSLHMAHIYYNPRVQPDDSLYTAYRKNLFFIGRSIGTWFNQDDLPLTADLMAKVWRDASYFIWGLKYKYLRVRPYVLEPGLKNLEETNWAAYPSGHAANSYINAYIYQELAPQFSDIFIKDAYDMAHSREIIGVHYPSDSESARIFATQFVSELFADEEFRKEFEKVKKEWAVKAHEDFSKPNVVPIIEKTPACSKKCE